MDPQIRHLRGRIRNVGEMLNIINWEIDYLLISRKKAFTLRSPVLLAASAPLGVVGLEGSDVVIKGADHFKNSLSVTLLYSVFP